VKRTGIILLIVLAGSSLYGQQLPVYSQYLYNKFLINPAVAGSDGYTSISLTAREQWVGYYGAPRTFSLSMQTRLLKKSFILRETRLRRRVYRPGSDGKIGLGGYIFNDRNGLVQRTGFQATYAYHMWLQNSTQFSLGLALTGYHYKINEKEINFDDPNEPWLNSDFRRGMLVPDVTFGAYILNPRFSAGFSADQLTGAVAKLGNYGYENFRMSRHFYLFGSYYFELNSYMELQPSFLFMMSEQVKPQADIGLTYIMNQDFWAGLSYRTSGALIGLLGIKYQNIFIGYAFDFTLQEIQRITYGTHEITFALKFGDSLRRYRWLDRY
jgi:type IX secretion system PorP/SprF family membrane protein